MRPNPRQFDLIRILRDGRLHRARDLAQRLGVSIRTIYRDMDQLIASGLPVKGARGTGYQAIDAIVLPPLTLSQAELDVLTLGLAILAETADTQISAAARSLSAKIDATLPEQALPQAEDWKLALTPLADTARGVSHIPTLRSAIRGRQKLQLAYRRPDGTLTRRTAWPLHLDNWGRVWTLTAWCEWRETFREFRVDLIESATPLPELYTDEPGKRLRDYAATRP